MKNKAPNKAFCIAAWSHTFISPQSERKLCCVSLEDTFFSRPELDNEISCSDTYPQFTPTSLEDHWNSDFLKSIRLQMLKGEIPKECLPCHENVVSQTSYREYFNNNLFPNLIEQAIKNTKKDGSTELKPISYDYRFNNTCNFSCRMCGNKLSSKWEKEVIENNMWSKQNEPWLIPEVRAKIESFQKKVVEQEFMLAIEKKQIKEIYWAGGEPLLWDIHWRGMQKLIETDQAKDVEIRYNTNLSLTRYKSLDLFQDLLAQFKNVSIMASIDATGKIGEYIRSGLVWEKWLENIKTARDFCETNSNAKLLIDITLTLPGLFDLKSLILLSTELRIPILSKLIITYDTSVVLSPLALPRKSLNLLLNDLIKFNILNISEYNKDLLESLVELKKCKTYEELNTESYKEEFLRGREKQLEVERIRKDKFTLADIYKEREDIYKWWIS